MPGQDNKIQSLNLRRIISHKEERISAAQAMVRPSTGIGKSLSKTCMQGSEWV
jgi:hypothetical protein